MRKFVAMLSVPVALIAAAAPAAATAGAGATSSRAVLAVDGSSAAAQTSGKFYLSDNRQYLQSVSAHTAVGGRPVRHVLLTGYKPAAMDDRSVIRASLNETAGRF